jgi:putative ABC transport system permease protein
MALGAQARDVLGMVLSQGILLTAAGLATGLIGALVFTRVLRATLYGVTSNDPVTYAIVALVLVTVTLAACYLPARRATRVDPMVALRHE